MPSGEQQTELSAPIENVGEKLKTYSLLILFTFLYKTHIFLISASKAEADGPEGEAEGDGLEDEGVRAAAAIHARVHRRLQGPDQPEAADVRHSGLGHGHRHGTHLHLPLLAFAGGLHRTDPRLVLTSPRSVTYVR